MTILNLLILSLATWRLAYMLVREDGPMKWIARFRARFSFLKVFQCVHCMSIYCAFVLWLLTFTPLWWVVWLLAISGLALMLHRYTGFHVEV